MAHKIIPTLGTDSKYICGEVAVPFPSYSCGYSSPKPYRNRYPKDTPDTSTMATDGFVKSWPKLLLRVEGATILASTIWAYSQTEASWWLFAGGLLLPDLGMLGFLSNSVVGSATYNSFHTETPPVLLLCTGYAQQSPRMISAALIWLAHINSE